MPKGRFKAGTAVSLALGLVAVAACSLVAPTRLATSAPTPAAPQVQILFPAHNQGVIEGVVFDIDILATDPVAGVQRVELYVDERLHGESESESAVEAYRVTMNWFATAPGWHKFAVFAYRPNGTASRPHVIALEVLARESPSVPPTSQGEA